MRYENVVLMVVDSLRADCLSCYGGRVSTPNVDRLAREGLLFEQAYSNAPDTLTSVPSLFTSVLPCFLMKGLPLLSTLLRRRGWLTVALNPNVLLLYSPVVKIRTEFDHYDSLLSTAREKTEAYVEFAISKLAEAVSFSRRLAELLCALVGRLPLPIARPTPPCELLLDLALRLLEKRERKTFIWLQIMDVHEPYLPPPEHLGRELGVWQAYGLNRKLRYFSYLITEEDARLLRELYEGEVRHLDHALGAFLERLAECCDMDRTLVVLTADHGEAFGEHGTYGHMKELYEENIRVPLIMSGPEQARVRKPVSLLDLAPTILRLCGLRAPLHFQGEDLLALAEANRPGEVVAMTDYAGSKLCYRRGDHKLILDLARGRMELYDLAKDPGERINLAGDEAGLVRELVRRLLGALSAYGRKLRLMSALRRVRERLGNRGELVNRLPPRPS